MRGESVEEGKRRRTQLERSYYNDFFAFLHSLPLCFSFYFHDTSKDTQIAFIGLTVLSSAPLSLLDCSERRSGERLKSDFVPLVNTVTLPFAVVTSAVLRVRGRLAPLIHSFY